MLDPMKEQRRLFDAWVGNVKKFSEMTPMMDDCAKLFQPKIPGMDVYNQLFDDYKKAIGQVNFDVNSMFQYPQELAEACVKFYQNMMRPWVEFDEELIENVLKGDTDAAIRFFTELSDKYETTFGKVVRMMNLGINMEAANEQQAAMDAYYKLMFAAGKLSVMMTKSNQEAAKTFTDGWKHMMEEGRKASSFQEFYDLWYRTNEKSMEDLFATAEFSAAFGEFTDKYFRYLTASNKVVERNLSFLPIPTNKDMNGLYRTVYDLRKDVRDLKKEMESCKSETVAATKAVK